MPGVRRERGGHGPRGSAVLAHLVSSARSSPPPQVVVHGHPFALAYCNTSRCPLVAAHSHVFSSKGTRALAALEHVQVALPRRVYHVRSLQGAPSSRAETSAVRSPTLEARQHAESRGELERIFTGSIAAIARARAR